MQFRVRNRRPDQPVAVYVTDDFPWPVITGMRRRSVEVIDSLLELGLRVIVLCHGTVPADFDPATVPGVEVRSVQRNRADVLAAKVSYWWRRLSDSPAPADSLQNVPLSMRVLVRRMCTGEAPELVVVAHVWNAGAINLLGRRRRRPTLVLDLPDVLSLASEPMRQIELSFGAPPWSLQSARAGARATIRNVTLVDVSEPAEVSTCRKFDAVLAVAREEAELIQRHAPRTLALWSPMAIPPDAPGRRVDDGRSLLFVASNSYFNIHAYSWLVTEVLPRLRARGLDFILRVVGDGSTQLPVVDDVELVGPVADLSELYRTSAVVLCPTSVGTGQPVKAAEALAHGCPSVMTSFSATRSQSIDGQTCLVADGAEDYASAVESLLADAALRDRIGAAARDLAEAVAASTPTKAALARARALRSAELS